MHSRTIDQVANQREPLSVQTTDCSTAIPPSAQTTSDLGARHYVDRARRRRRKHRRCHRHRQRRRDWFDSDRRLSTSGSSTPAPIPKPSCQNPTPGQRLTRFVRERRSRVKEGVRLRLLAASNGNSRPGPRRSKLRPSAAAVREEQADTISIRREVERSERASKQARKQASKHESKQASTKASKQTSPIDAGKQESRPNLKEQESRPATQEAPPGSRSVPQATRPLSSPRRLKESERAKYRYPALSW